MADDASSGPPPGAAAPVWETSLGLPALSRARLDELLAELLDRVGEVMSTQERLRALLDAVVGIATDLDLHSVLERIIAAACRLAGARYGALGVLGPDRKLAEFITHGVSGEERARIGPPPEGHGILGLLIEDPRPIRLHDINEHTKSYGFPANHPPMGNFLGVPIRTHGQVFGNLYLTEKQGGGDFTDEDEEVVVALAAAAGVAVENARLYEQSARRQRWLEAASEITETLLGEVDRTAALRLVVARAHQVADAELAVIMLPDGDGQLVVEVADGAEGLDGRVVAADDELVVPVMREGRTVVVEDVAKEAPSWLPVEIVGDLGPAILVPLASSSGVVGVLGVVSGRSERLQAYTGPDATLVESFAGQAALALERARAQQDRALIAVLEDRDRIAADLHDLVIQRLFATGLQLQGAARLSVRPEVVSRLNAAVDDLDATIRDIRASIFQLQHRPGEANVADAVDYVVREAARTLGFDPEVNVSGSLDDVPTRVRPELLAVLHEALTNVARHARASSAYVAIVVDDHLVLTVADNGRGLAKTGRRSGLRNMEVRAERWGGAFIVRANEPTGTIIEWRVPLSTAAAAR